MHLTTYYFTLLWSGVRRSVPKKATNNQIFGKSPSVDCRNSSCVSEACQTPRHDSVRFKEARRQTTSRRTRLTTLAHVIHKLC